MGTSAGAIMTTTTAKKRYTVQEFLALPDDGVERWLINGELRENEPELPGVPMTIRNRFHSSVMSNIAISIGIWRLLQPKPRGTILCGEAGIVFPPPIVDTFGVDVAYVSPEVNASQHAESQYLEGIPSLCVEIISRTDSYLKISEKTRRYFDGGVAIVWIINPYAQTVTVFTSDLHPMVYDINKQIPVHPSMPGYSPKVLDFFE